ncbi:heme ABC transporter ATP-binding protein [Nitriliruptoraceae bacterium ZYF776]|nr:heme ABC transporter ATP-binding protein [Profundirhabdus halotolerans]
MRRSLRPASRLPGRRAPGEVAVQVRDVVVELGGATILDGVDLDVHAGEVVVLAGPNGAGKSTLLGAVCGDVATTRGEVVVDGRPLTDWSGVELAQRRAMLLQHPTLTFPFTVTDVVRMGRAPWRATEAELEDEAAVHAAMREADVLAFADRQFTSLSGGERARAALARVLAQRTGVLLLDEPTAALDIHHQELVLELARARARAGDAVVVVLHDLGLAAAHADRIVLLDGGRVAAVGAPAEVLTAGGLSTVYRHDIEVIAHPRTGVPMITPRR